ncbi:MAG TPA: succinate dehydrogenase, hydrophobic membrane anchor protein [Salinisphaeraceae bacterium]|nr:succinate dehydrogenase, hydrophobic membrane anchor protein [Salinisphaeraceae bacterium]
MSIRTPLARARGLGSAGSGVEHWWRQRLSAAALVPLTLWFVASLVAHVGADYDSVIAWLTAPVSAILMILYVAALYYHSQLGLQVIIEDYIHTDWIKIAAIVALQFVNILLAVAAIFSIIVIVLGAGG